LAFDLGSAALVQRFPLPESEGEHALGDLTVTKGGDVYVADGLGGAVFRLRAGGAALERVLGPDTLFSPQTPALSPDGARLFVPDYLRGIGVLDVASGRLTWLAAAVPVALAGIDGLYFVDDATLLAVQNGTQPERIVRLHLDASKTRVDRFDVLEQGPALGDPTHGVIVGDRFYFIARSGWEHMNDDGSVKPGESAAGSVVMTVPVR
jgi:hypothetical protein